VAAGWKEQSGIDMVNQQHIEVVAVENDDIRHQVASRNGGLRSSKHIIGSFEQLQRVSSVCRLHSIKGSETRHEPMHCGNGITHGISLPQPCSVHPNRLFRHATMESD
jgi:hypothetical protein